MDNKYLKIIFTLFIIALIYSAKTDTTLSQTAEITPIDIGLRMNVGTPSAPNIIKVLVEPEGQVTSPLRIAKDGKIYGVILVSPTDPKIR